ncbi:unnamed protein product [Pylaiella littoralis]
MAARRRTTLAAVSTSSLNSRGSMGTASSGRPSSKQPSSRFSISTISSAGGRSTMGGGGGGGRPSMGTSRPSMGASRPSMGSSRPSMGRPSMGRPSMSTAGERKSSVGVRRSNSYGSSGGKSDTRPLMDKAHLSASLHKLMDYLLTHGYDQPLNKKKLLSPSGRDFNNITGFLFRQLDPNYMPSGRFEDDVVPFLKMVGYPFTISKSSLAAVGAPQTWPKVMGAISWIVDSLLYDEAIAEAEEEQRMRERGATAEQREQDREDGVDDQACTRLPFADLKNYVEFLNKAYSCFLEGEDEALQGITAEFSEAREGDDAGAEDFLEKLEEANEALSQTNQELLDQGNSLPQLKEDLKLSLSDNEKITTLLEEVNAQARIIQEKVDKRVEQERRLKEPIPLLEQASASLREQIARQEFSMSDMEGQLSERRRLRDAVADAGEKKLKARKEGWSAQVEVSSVKETVKESLNRYREQAEGLLLIPFGTKPAKNAGDTDYAVDIDESKLDVEDAILTKDVRGVIRPALKELKIAIVRRTSEFRRDLSNLLVEEDKAEECIGDVISEVELLHKQASWWLDRARGGKGRWVKRKEEAYNKGKYVLDQQVAGSKSRTQDEERRLESQNGTVENLDRVAAENKASTDVLRVQIEALKERMGMERKESGNVLQSVVETALDYQEREERCMAGLKERYRQHHEAILYGQTAYDVVVAEGEQEDTTSEQSPGRREQEEEEGQTDGLRNEQQEEDEEDEGLPGGFDIRPFSSQASENEPPKVCLWPSVPIST